MIISVIVDDKVIVKDNVAEFVNDDSFWSNYNTIHAIQINTDGESITENKDGTQETTSQSIIDTFSNKFDAAKQARETAEQTAQDNYINSWERVRAERNNLLKETDKYILSDFPISDSNKTSIETYRTSLRNITTTYSDEEPRNITFADNGNVSVDGSVVITMPSL